jgi:acyl-CoA synthetase (AMP-forming)/AMP-acid ligase II
MWRGTRGRREALGGVAESRALDAYRRPRHVGRSGDNVYPREIEEFLFRHPKIEAVQVPELKYGEELCAWIKLKPAAPAEIQDLCKGQIAQHKIPPDKIEPIARKFSETFRQLWSHSTRAAPGVAGS